MEQLEEWIKRHEGFRTHPYLDAKEKLTIGYGRNLQENGISKEEAECMFSNDIERCKSELKLNGLYTGHNDYVKEALVNMCFHMGITRLLGFKRMIEALRKKDYQEAAREALDSKWGIRFNKRAREVYERMLMSRFK